MNLNKIKSESKFERPPALDAGAYPARTVQMIVLGVQEQRPYKGEAKLPKLEMKVTYELLDEFLLDEDGGEILDKPRWVSEDYTLSSLDSDLATSTKRYAAYDPEMKYEGGVFKTIGTPVILSLSHEPKKGDPSVVYNNVKNVSSMRAKDVEKAPKLVNEPKVFDFYEPDMEVFSSLPEWLQKKIKEAVDYPGSDLEKLVEGAPTPSDSGRDEPGKDPDPKTPDNSDSEKDW